MMEPIELAVATPEGIADCRIEQNNEDADGQFSVTILYPHTINGRIQSKVYEHSLKWNKDSGTYCFADADSVHPLISKMVAQLSEAILNNNNNTP